MIHYRFFFNVIDAQEIWLNNMSDKGFRLTEIDRCKYTFTEAPSSEYTYIVDAVTTPAEAVINQREALLDSHKFRIMRNKMPLMGNTTFLICEKKNTETPIEISTNPFDAIVCYRKLRRLVLILDVVLFLFTILSLSTNLFINAQFIKISLAFAVFYLTSTGFKSSQIINDYIVRYKLSEPL